MFCWEFEGNIPTEGLKALLSQVNNSEDKLIALNWFVGEDKKLHFLQFTLNSMSIKLFWWIFAWNNGILWTVVPAAASSLESYY